VNAKPYWVQKKEEEAMIVTFSATTIINTLQN